MNAYTQPDFGSPALIIIDTQCDTLDGQPLEIRGTSAALPNMVRLLQGFRASGLPIVHIVRIYLPDGSNVDLCRRDAVEDGHAMLLAGSSGSQIAAGLVDPGSRLDSARLLSGGIQKLSEHEAIIYKPRWGAFYGTPLQGHLQALKVSTLVFAGCNFPNCPRTSIYEASERDYRIVLVGDAVSGLYERGAAEIENIGVSLMTADEVLSEVSCRTSREHTTGGTQRNHT